MLMLSGGLSWIEKCQHILWENGSLSSVLNHFISEAIYLIQLHNISGHEWNNSG